MAKKKPPNLASQALASGFNMRPTDVVRLRDIYIGTNERDETREKL